MSHKHKNVRADQLRRALAQEAARIMSEQGVDNFLLAKRKAAERLGVADASVLPNNKEIEDALAEHHRLFGANRHQAALRELRGIALQAMRLLQEFEPRLVGPVLTGMASEHSEIVLHIFSEQPEAVAWRLEEQGIPHKLNERRLRYEPGRTVPYPVFHFVAGKQAIDAVVFPIDGIRQAPSSPVDGRPMRRGDTAEVEELISSSAVD
ncbi:MAG: hypothetical protein H7Y02_04425 [Candidatus Obscuribacterales bacterium]|nr:hypothetical protein [Steroidobacteraceae bacterium]